jgi:hypothetical protein
MPRLCYYFACVVGAAVVAAPVVVKGAVPDINGVNVTEREFNDDGDSTLTTTSTYPALVRFDDRNVNGDGAGGEFANRHVWRFSADGGATDYAFDNDDFFQTFMDVTLNAAPTSPRKEAGFLFDTVGGQGQFIVNTDAHEMVAFGGPIPFYAFPATYDAGETIRLGVTYFRDTDGLRKIIYHAGDQSSPAQAFTNLEQGIVTGSRLGGYLQVAIAPNSPANFGMADYANITIMPEPSGAAVVLLGAAAGLRRHRRRRLDRAGRKGWRPAP